MSTLISTHRAVKISVEKRHFDAAGEQKAFSNLRVLVTDEKGVETELSVFLRDGCIFEGFGTITDTPTYDGDGDNVA